MPKTMHSTAAKLPADHQPAVAAHASGRGGAFPCQRLCWPRCPSRRCTIVACVLALGLSALLWLGSVSSGTLDITSLQLQRTPQPGIPRILHFTARSEKLHSEYLPIMRSWFQAYPNFQIYLWRDQDIACLVRLRYPSWLPAFNGSGGLWLQTPLERSDVARILALHALGGLYLDLDTKPVADAGHLFDRPLAGAMLATEPPEHALMVFGMDYLVSNAVMFSAPGHPFFEAYLDTVAADVKKPSGSTKRSNLNAPETTGPLVLHRTYETYRKNNEVACSSPECRVHLFAPEVFCPVHDTCQTSRLQSICNATTLAELPDGKRNLCVKLWARNFTQASFSSSTLGVHLFSHISTYPGAKPTFFDAKETFPRLQLFADTEQGCKVS